MWFLKVLGNRHTMNYSGYQNCKNYKTIAQEGEETLAVSARRHEANGAESP